MDKIAMVKQAEVNGVIAGLVDSGYIKLASDEDFNTVCSVVAENIPGEDWTFDQVIEKTAEVMEEVYAIYEENGTLQKEADEKEEYTEADLMATLGSLTLAKEAGEITDAEYAEKTATVKEKLEEGWEKAKANKGKVMAGAAGLAALGLAAKRGYLSPKGMIDVRRDMDSLKGMAANAPKAAKGVAEKAKKFFAPKVKERGLALYSAKK